MIKLEITANSVEEYKEILGDLAEGKLVPELKVATDKPKKEAKSEQAEKEKPKKEEKQNKEADKVEDSKPETPTKDEMTNLIKACLDAGLRKEVIAAFGKFEAKKFPQVAESDYADLKEVLEELLA